MQGRVLVIGLDGATFDLIRPWIRGGHLPNLERFMKEGSWGELRSVVHPFSAQAWTTFATGMNPGKHGIFDFVERRSGTYDIQFFNAHHRRARALWNLLGERERKVIVVNIPMTYPPEEVNGLLISGMDTPDVHCHFTHPKGLYEEIRQRFGRYIIMSNAGKLMKRGRPDLARKRTIEMMENHYEVTRYLMRTYPWDFFLVNFSASDNAMHHFWNYMDPGHVQHRPEEAARYGGTVLDVHKRLDEMVGIITRELPDDVTVFIISDHGHGPTGDRMFRVNRWLRESGYLVFREDSGTGDLRRGWLRTAAVRSLQILFETLRVYLPTGIKSRLVLWMPGLRNKVESSFVFSHIDWSRTRAYSEEIRANIWINLQGREPKGTVSPGEGYEKLRGEIIAKLKALVDPETGEPVVDDVYRREDLFHGPCMEQAPDILFTLRDQSIVLQLSRPAARERFLERIDFNSNGSYIQGGSHRLQGILFVKGPSISEGTEVMGARIEDLAPTILYVMGEPIPKDMDGRILKGLFKDGVLRASPPAFIQGEVGVGRGAMESSGYSAREEEEIRERLSGLGYMG